MGVMNMIINNDYPKIKKRVSKFLLIRKIILIIFLVAFITCLTINLATGGRLWFIYVLFGELIFYYAFLNKPLIDNVLIKRILILVIIIMGYLYTIDKINETNWSVLVIEVISFSFLIIQLIIFFTNYEYHKNKIILLFFTSIFSCVGCFLGIIGVYPINWALIVIGAIGLFNLMILCTFYFKTTTLELKKYFSLK